MRSGEEIVVREVPVIFLSKLHDIELFLFKVSPWQTDQGTMGDWATFSSLCDTMDVCMRRGAMDLSLF